MCVCSRIRSGARQPVLRNVASFWGSNSQGVARCHLWVSHPCPISTCSCCCRIIGTSMGGTLCHIWLSHTGLISTYLSLCRVVRTSICGALCQSPDVAHLSTTNFYFWRTHRIIYASVASYVAKYRIIFVDRWMLHDVTLGCRTLVKIQLVYAAITVMYLVAI